MKELIWNLKSEFGDRTSAEYEVFFVRGSMVFITPQLINEYFGISAPSEEFECRDLDTVASVVAGGKVTKWEESSVRKFSMSMSLHVVLYMICVFN